MASSPKIGSIEEGLRHKSEKETRTYTSELEKQFREKYRKYNEVIVKQFDLKHEFVLDHHACSHLGTILKPGRLYITPRYILFYSNILGSKTKKKIPYEKILEIRKESNSFVASPIEIQLKFKRYTFASFIYRESCYQHMLMQWKSNKEGFPLDIKIPLEEKSEDDEGESASLHEQRAPEPMAELKTVWGTGELSNERNHTDSEAILDGPPPSPPKPRSGGRHITMSKAPTFKEEKKRRCCSWLF